MKHNNSRKYLAAMILSGLAGAALGLLLAPKSGKETRAQLKNTGQSLQNAARQATELNIPGLIKSQPVARLPQFHGYEYDAIIIGGGHNGLVTAAYLAKAGKKVLLFERRPIIGGAAVTEEFSQAPGFKFSSVAGGAGHLLPQIISDLQLHRHGLEIIPADPLVVAPQPDGTYLTIWRDVDRTVEEISRFSQRDAARYPAFLELMGKISGLVAALMQITPPHLPNPTPGELKELLKLLGPARKLSKKDIHNTLRILPMSVADLLDEWFESEALRGLVAAQAVSGITWGPRATGTAYTLLYHTAISGGHPFGAAGTVKGGMGALTGALAQAALHYGVEIVTGAGVERIAVEAGRACGVIMADGRVFSAAAIISNADPRTTYLKLLGPDYLDPFFVRQVNNIKFRGSGTRIHMALRELPHFTALNGGQPSELLTGHLKIAPGINYLEKAYDAAKYGGFATRPALDVTIPSLADPGLAPAGQHVMSIYAQYAAYHLHQSAWDEQREALGQTVIETLAHYAPNLKNAILHTEVITPLDLERVYGLPEGNPHHGEITLDQFLYMRPIPGWANYRAPVEGLYLCGAGTHPGGGVTGIPGKNAAREILKDWGK